MVGFNYTYLELGEIQSIILPISEYGIIEYAVLSIIILLSVSIVFFVFPILYSIGGYIEKQKRQRTRKNLLKQIALQKDIEDSIESEVS